MKQLNSRQREAKTVIKVILCLFCLLPAASIAQQSIAGRDAKTTRDATFTSFALGDSSITAGNWLRMDVYEAFNLFVSVSLDTPTVTYWAEAGLDTAQVVFAFEEYAGGSTTPTSSSKGYYEDGDGGVEAIITLTKADTAAAQGNQIRLYKGFRGKGQTATAIGAFLRLTVTIHDTLSNLTLDSVDLVGQP